MTIDEQLTAMRKDFRLQMEAETVRIETAYYQQKFPQLGIESVKREDVPVDKSDGVIWSCWRVNGYRLKWTHDCYSNGTFNWPDGVPPVGLVAVFADKMVRLEERTKTDYTYRLVQGMYISLAKDHYATLSAADMFELLRQADGLPVDGGNRYRSGFRAWLRTRSYSCREGGALSDTLRKWEGRKAFVSLLAKSEGDIV